MINQVKEKGLLLDGVVKGDSGMCALEMDRLQYSLVKHCPFSISKLYIVACLL